MCLFCVSTDEKHSSKHAIFFLTPNRIKKNESYLTLWHTKVFQNIKLVSPYSKSLSHENSRCLHCASVQIKHMVKKAIGSLIANRMEKWVIFDTMAYQRLPGYQIGFPLFPLFIVSLIPNRMGKWVIFDTMAYQRLPEYQISFPLLKVCEPWKFHMSLFCVSSDENIV